MSLLKLKNVAEHVDRIYPMSDNVYPCRKPGWWYVFISYGDGKTPLAAFPKSQWEFCCSLPGGGYHSPREIYKQGLLKMFKLTPIPHRPPTSVPEGSMQLPDGTVFTPDDLAISE